MAKESLLHIYYKESLTKHLEAYMDGFKSKSIDARTVDAVDDFDIYVIEIHDKSVEVQNEILNLFANKKHPIVFADASVPIHSKLQDFLNIRFVISQKHDTAKVIQKIRLDFKRFKQERYFQLFCEEMVSDELYFVYEDDRVVYKSAKIDKEFSSFDEIAKNAQKSREIVVGESKYSVERLKIADTIFTRLLKSDINDCSDLSLCSRIEFMELLKNKLIKKGEKGNKLSLITINIKNFYSDFILKDIIKEVKFSLPGMVDLCQYDGNFYVALYEKNDFAKIMQYAKQLNVKLYTLTNIKEIAIPIEIFCIDLNGFELGYILQKLNYLSRENIDKEVFLDAKTHLISNMENGLNDYAVLRSMFDLISTKHGRFKLYNLYNGVVISSKAEFLQFKNESLILKLDKNQLKLINMEKKTVLKLYMYEQSIEMSLQKIDIKNKIAMFHDFKLSEQNITKRKHTRVKAESNMVVNLIGDGKTFKGNILDISIKSIAAIFPHSDIIEKIKGKEVDLIFELVLVQSKISHKVRQRVKVAALHLNQASGVVKLICDLIPDMKNEEILTRYIYSREKDIVDGVSGLS